MPEFNGLSDELEEAELSTEELEEITGGFYAGETSSLTDREMIVYYGIKPPQDEQINIQPMYGINLPKDIGL
ncbi:MAG: hypothetical protein ACQEP9_09895 [Bacillota bacterium]